MKSKNKDFNKSNTCKDNIKKEDNINKKKLMKYLLDEISKKDNFKEVIEKFSKS